MVSSNIKSYECKIQTISPIHIGSGNKYTPSEFIPTKKPMKVKKKDGSREIKDFPVIRRINFDKYYSNLSPTRRDEFLDKITEPNFRLHNFDSNIQEFKRYDSINESKEQSPREIVEHIRTMDELYIPGSSLKGAIKTAITYNNVGKEDFDTINQFITDGNYGNLRIDKRGYTTFIDQIFASQGGGRSAQYNISKFLQISDSSTLGTGKIQKALTIKAKQKTKQNPNEFVNYQRNGSTVVTYFETIPKGKILNSKITTNYDSKTYRSLNLENKHKMIDIDNIKNAIYKFSNDFIDHELSFYEKYGDENLEKFYEQLNNINKEDEPVIKIGQGSGFLATTISLKIKEKDRNLYEKIRKTGRRNYKFEYPKTRKIIKPQWPLGWVKLKINEIN